MANKKKLWERPTISIKCFCQLSQKHDSRWFLAAGGTEKIVIFSKWALRELHLVNKHPFKIALEIRKGRVKKGTRMKNWKKWTWVRKDGGGWCKWKEKKWQGKDFLSYHKEESNQSVGFCVDDSTVAWLVVAQIGTRFVSQLGLFPRQGGCKGELADHCSLWLKEEGCSLFALILHFINSTCDVFIHLKKMMKWSPMGVFQFLNNKDVCFFGDARRVNFHQPLFPHYTGRVFNIQVGGSLKGTNFGNPHLEKHLGFLWFFSSEDLKGLPSKIWDPWQHFKVVGDKSCWHSSADQKKRGGQLEGTMKQEITIESSILCLKLLFCCLQNFCVPVITSSHCYYVQNNTILLKSCHYLCVRVQHNFLIEAHVFRVRGNFQYGHYISLNI